MDGIFKSAAPGGITTRSSSNKLIEPLCHRVSGYKAISHIGPRIWNRLPRDLKSAKTTSSFKHRMKNFYFKELNKTDKDIYKYF